jgi:hypothetical protein
MGGAPCCCCCCCSRGVRKEEKEGRKGAREEEGEAGKQGNLPLATPSVFPVCFVLMQQQQQHRNGEHQ